jgi:hypothetical protein
MLSKIVFMMHQTREFVETLCLGTYQTGSLEQYHMNEDKKTAPKRETVKPVDWSMEIVAVEEDKDIGNEYNYDNKLVERWNENEGLEHHFGG